MKPKTKKSLAKRIMVTKRGKFMRRRMSAQHLAHRKSRRTLKSSRLELTLAKGNARRVRSALSGVKI